MAIYSLPPPSVTTPWAAHLAAERFGLRLRLRPPTRTRPALQSLYQINYFFNNNWEGKERALGGAAVGGVSKCQARQKVVFTYILPDFIALAL